MASLPLSASMRRRVSSAPIGTKSIASLDGALIGIRATAPDVGESAALRSRQAAWAAPRPARTSSSIPRAMPSERRSTGFRAKDLFYLARHLGAGDLRLRQNRTNVQPPHDVWVEAIPQAGEDNHGDIAPAGVLTQAGEQFGAAHFSGRHEDIDQEQIRCVHIY